MQDFKKTLPNPEQVQNLVNKLWPICRSIMGEGYRQSLDILAEVMPTEKISFKTGEKVYDWEIPLEWNIKDAYIKDESGKKIVDFQEHNLHVVSYSTPVDKTLSKKELEENLFSLPEHPEWIPYRTTYYKQTWGFCATDKLKKSLKEGKYQVKIDSTLTPGELVVGQKILKSKNANAKDVLISTYLCHPSMGNNELSGPVVTAFLYKALSQITDLKYNYRFVVCPETIGSIAYLSRFEKELKASVMGGLVVTCCGNPGTITVKKTKSGNHEIDRVIEHTVKAFKNGDKIIFKDYFPFGSDERQYSSPGFNFQMSSICRSMYGDYPEYHTSADDKNFITTKALIESVELHLKTILTLEYNCLPKRVDMHCEPMLSKHNLISALGADKNLAKERKIYSYILAYADGTVDLLTMAQKAEEDFFDVYECYKTLKNSKILV